MEKVYFISRMKWKIATLLFLFVFPSVVLAQTNVVSGTVISDGITLPGVNVLEKGTSNGTVTNVDGKYTIALGKPNAVLVFSMIGMLTHEQAVTAGSVVDGIQLK